MSATRKIYKRKTVKRVGKKQGVKGGIGHHIKPTEGQKRFVGKIFRNGYDLGKGLYNKGVNVVNNITKKKTPTSAKIGNFYEGSDEFFTDINPTNEKSNKSRKSNRTLFGKARKAIFGVKEPVHSKHTSPMEDPEQHSENGDFKYESPEHTTLGKNKLNLNHTPL